MSLLPQTRALLQYLQQRPHVRQRIAAPPDRTLLYAGAFFKPVWREIEQLRSASPAAAAKVMLPEVLAAIATPDGAAPNLKAWAQQIDTLSPWRSNGFIAWRALSGIFAANARGTVSFVIGSGVTRGEKVFAATELPVLMRNPNVDPITQDVLAYYQRCLDSGQSALNFGFIAA